MFFPTCCCAMSLIIKFVPAFTVSASMVNAFFTGGKDPGKISFQPLALAGLVARIPGFRSGCPGSVPGQGIRSHFTPPLTAASLRSSQFLSQFNLYQLFFFCNFLQLICNLQKKDFLGIIILVFPKGGNTSSLKLH